MAKAAGRRFSAVMVGAGDDLPRYKTLAAALGLADRCAFRDPMRARQAFRWRGPSSSPSRAEAMPCLIVLEALAAGMPMIATAVGGIPEIFPVGSPALVRPEAGDIARMMVRATGNPSLSPRTHCPAVRIFAPVSARPSWRNTSLSRPISKFLTARSGRVSSGFRFPQSQFSCGQQHSLDTRKGFLGRFC